MTVSNTDAPCLGWRALGCRLADAHAAALSANPVAVLTYAALLAHVRAEAGRLLAEMTAATQEQSSDA